MQRAAHGGRVFAEDYAAACGHLDWPHAPFEIPDDVRAAWLEAGRCSLPSYESWQSRVAALPPERRRLLDRLREGRLPENWDRPLRDWRARAALEGKTQGGINSSADIVEVR